MIHLHFSKLDTKHHTVYNKYQTELPIVYHYAPTGTLWSTLLTELSCTLLAFLISCYSVSLRNAPQYPFMYCSKYSFELSTFSSTNLSLLSCKHPIVPEGTFLASVTVCSQRSSPNISKYTSIYALRYAFTYAPLYSSLMAANYTPMLPLKYNFNWTQGSSTNLSLGKVILPHVICWKLDNLQSSRVTAIMADNGI